MSAQLCRLLSTRTHYAKKWKYLNDTVLKTCFVCIRQRSSFVSDKFSTDIPEFENEPGINTHEDLYRFSLSNPNEFWGKLARSRLSWFEDFDIVQDCDISKGKIKWFLNGKLNSSGKPISNDSITTYLSTLRNMKQGDFIWFCLT